MERPAWRTSRASISSTPRRSTAAAERRILDNIQTALDSFDVILISDQAETSQGGVVTPAVRGAAGRPGAELS